MAAEKQLIKDFVEAFAKNRPVYEDRCRRAAQMVDTLMGQKGIMAIVTSRVKDPERLREKLIRRDQEEGRNYQTMEDIYRDVPDLMGIRVALYFPADAQKIEGHLRPLFQIVRTKEHPARIAEYDDYYKQGFTAYKRRVYPGYEGRRFDGYCAIHIHVRMDGEPETEPVIEIQVASLLMHAWSEVEHDLAYKNKMGQVSREEYEVLDEINGLVLAGEIALNRLNALSQQRIEQETGPFASHYALESYLTKWQSDRGMGDGDLGNVETLYKLYEMKDMLSRDQVDVELTKLTRRGAGGGEPLADRLVDQFENKTMVKKVVADAVMKLNGLDPETHHQTQLGKFMAKWNKLEKAIQAALRTRGYKAYNSTVTWRLVVEEYALTGPIREAYHRLRLERNKIVHGYVPTTAAGFDRLNADMDNLLEMLKEEYGV